MEYPFSESVVLAGCVLLLNVADADEVLEPGEMETIRDILMQYFEIPSAQTEDIINKGRNLLSDSTGMFDAGRILNSELEHADKLEFVKCIFELGYSDGELHYLEHHTIRKIANILNIEHSDLVAARIEVQDWFEE